jgi:four helix bundle protein
VALQELEETAYWLELLTGAEIVTTDKLKALQQEVDELIAIFTTIAKRVKEKGRRVKDEG